MVDHQNRALGLLCLLHRKHEITIDICCDRGSRKTDQNYRETTDSPGSTLGLRSFRTCSSWRDTIPASHRSPPPAVLIPTVSCPILAGSAMVQYASMSDMSRGADIRDRVNPSELDRATHQRHQLRPASRGLAHDRGLGGLWNLEVCVYIGVCKCLELSGPVVTPDRTSLYSSPF